MLAQNNEYLQEVVSGVQQLTEEEKIRQQCEAREINAYWERIRTIDHQNALNTISAQAGTIAEQANTIQKNETEIAHLRALLEQNGIKY